MIWHNPNTDPADLTAFAAPFMSGYIGIEFIEIGDDWLKARMPVDHRTKNPGGRLQGGASAALAEAVASAAARATLDTTVSAAAGLEVKANHIRPVGSGFVYALAKAEAIGRTTQFWSVRITDEEGRLVCFATVTMAVVPVARGNFKDSGEQQAKASA